MSATQEPVRQSSSARLDEIVTRFEDACQAGQRPDIDDYLPREDAERRTVLVELAAVDLERRLKAGEAARVEQYLDRYPELAEAVLELVQVEFAQRRRAEPDLAPEDYCRRLAQHEEALRRWMADCPTVPPQSSPEAVETGPAMQEAEAEIPAHFGRYRITGKLGSGGFGAVYRGYDDDFQREVAIKVPHRERIARPEDAEAYLAEARILAGLDHPHIVPVHDVGRTDDGPCFVVSKLVAGNGSRKRGRESKSRATSGFRPWLPFFSGSMATTRQRRPSRTR